MMGIPKIAIPQESVEVGLPGGASPSPGPIVLGDLFPRDERESRPSVRISRK
jgi:hypothetical protein